MLKAVLVASAFVLSALTVSAPPASAAVQPHLSQAATNVVRTVGWGHRHHHFGHFRRGFVIGAPVYAYSYGGGCGWLRHRAIVTGSPYWWHRYRVCRGW